MNKLTSLTTDVELVELEYEVYVDAYHDLYNQVFDNHFDLDIHSMLSDEESALAKKLGTNLDNLETYTFGFSFKNEIVGWIFCIQKDWQTLEIRSVGILPSFQGQGLYSKALPVVRDMGKAEGYQKLVSYHHPTNAAAMIPGLKAGFYVTGIEMSERFGFLVELSHFYNKARDEAFQFRCGHRKLSKELLDYLPPI